MLSTVQWLLWGAIYPCTASKRQGCLLAQCSSKESRYPHWEYLWQRTSSEASQKSAAPALVIAAVSSTLQLQHQVTASGLLILKASAAGASYSMAHFVRAAPARCSPSLSPPHPAKMSMVASTRLSSSAAGASLHAQTKRCCGFVGG